MGEWRGYRWRPVLPWDKVSSLVDEDGYFYRYPEELYANNPNLEEIDAELRAQVSLAIKKGINVQYIDTHYRNTADYHRMTEILKKIGRDYNIPVSGSMGEKRIDIYSVPAIEKKENAIQMLQELDSGLYMWVCHPGIDSPEQNALIHTAIQDIRIAGGVVGCHRAAVLNALTSTELKSVVLKKEIALN